MTHPQINLKLDETDLKTIGDFGQQWTRFPENTGWHSSVECLRDHLGPLMSVEEFKGARIADIGSGSGRIVSMLLEAGAANVTAIEPSESFRVLERAFMTERDRVTLINDVGEAVESVRNLDFVISFGVLHHILDPRAVVGAAYQALRPGGKIIVWLYGYEGNELYLGTFGRLRRITKRLPDAVLSVIAASLNVGLDAYIPLCRRFRMPMRDYMLNHFMKLDRRTRKVTVFDQLNPAYAKYYREPGARALIADAGFQNVRLYHRHGYSWTVIGTKPIE
jgi:SAM-dependent methyltransferase